MDTVLSLDWDYLCGARPAPDSTLLAGVRAGLMGMHRDWVERAWARTRPRPAAPDGWAPEDWSALDADFPLLVDPAALLAHVRDVAPDAPWLVAEGHNEILRVLEPGREWRVVNLDSHADLFSHARDALDVDAVPGVGNWAGHALRRGVVREYACVYPTWHLEAMHGEGLARDGLRRRVIGSALGPVSDRVTLEVADRADAPFDAVSAGRVAKVFVAHSSPWCAPQHDDAFFALLAEVRATRLTPLADRRDPWRLHWQVADVP